MVKERCGSRVRTVLWKVFLWVLIDQYSESWFDLYISAMLEGEHQCTMEGLLFPD